MGHKSIRDVTFGRESEILCMKNSLGVKFASLPLCEGTNTGLTYWHSGVFFLFCFLIELFSCIIPEFEGGGVGGGELITTTKNRLLICASFYGM